MNESLLMQIAEDKAAAGSKDQIASVALQTELDAMRRWADLLATCSSDDNSESSDEDGSELTDDHVDSDDSVDVKQQAPPPLPD